MTPKPAPKRRRAMIIAMTSIVVLAGIAFPVVRFWDRSPRPPDIEKITLREAMAFEATPDYLKMSERRRTQYSTAVARKLMQLPFEEMLRITMDPANMDMHRTRLNHLRKLPNFDKLNGDFAADFLEKFYKLPEFKRTVYITALAVYMELDARADPDRYQMPKPGDFHSDAVRLFSGQSPVMKAYGMQFMLDLNSQRKRLGLPDRPLPMR